MTLESSFDIAAFGLDAHGERMRIHANNIANTDTPNYVRKIPVLVENNTVTFEDILAQMRKGVIHAGISYAPNGVDMVGVVRDPTPGRRVHMPGHPQADEDGYITLSNVNVLSDVADATMSARLYEANLAVVSLVKGMANRALEIGRGQ